MTKNFDARPPESWVSCVVDRVLIGLTLTFSILNCSCGSGGASNSPGLRDEGRRVFSSNPRSQTNTNAHGASEVRNVGSWSIVLGSFSGETSQAAATARASVLMELLGRGDINVRTTKAGSAVLLGNYPSYNTDAAQKDLRWVRSQRIGGVMPFRRAFLAPPIMVIDPGQYPELSLGRARMTFGSRAKYTLQIGAYESPDATEAKRAAEKAALSLRQEGTLAFYHHGSTRSMVTVGVFNDDDLGANLQPSSPGLIALMKMFPHNLLNGQGVLERRLGSEQLQSSRLVLIPQQ